MTILPVVERELRVASRRRGTYWTRSTVALVAMLIGAFAMLLNFGAPQAKLGSYIFIGLASFSVLHCLLAGRLATADCLSEEKREGTLGLLFLTDLKGYDVVLGKLVATSLNSFYGLLAIVPVLAIPLLLGGVTNGQFWRTVLVLVNTFLFSLAVGMFCSAVSRDIRKTMGLNFGLMFFFTAILPGCAAVIAFNSPGHFFSQELCFTSPLYGFFWAGIAPFLPPMVLGKVMTTPPVQFWQSLAVIHGLSWLFLLLAARIAPRSWQDRPAPPVRTGKARVRELWHAWSYGSPAKRPAFRKRLLDLNAFYWHAARARLKPLHVWIFFGLMGVWWLWGRIVSGTVWLDESVNLTMALMLNTTFKLWVAAEAGQRLAEDQKIGALELVLSTPLGVRDILRGQLLALRRQFLLPVLVAIGMEFFLMHASVAHANRPNSTTYAFWLAGIFMLPMDLAALIWVSMARGLTAKSYNRALIGTVYCILVLPWLAYLLTLGLIALWFEGWLGLNWEPSQGFHLGTWLAAALAADLGFGLRARWLLQHRLRELAMQRLALPPPRAPKSPPRRKRDEKPAPIVELQSSFRNIEQPTSNIEHRMPDLRHSEPKVQSAILSVSASPEETPAMAALPLSQFDVQRSMFDVRCSRNSFLRRFFLFTLILLLACTAYYFLPTHPKYPPPLIVPASLNQGPLRIFPAINGAAFILPDGSVWHWGLVPGMLPRSPVPTRLGTNTDWIKMFAIHPRSIALRSDGTLWQGFPLAQGSTASFDAVEQIGTNHDWIDVAGGVSSFAIKRDGTLWAWGDNSRGQLGIGPGPNQTNLVQVGTNSDWTAVSSCGWSGNVALRRDGTLWAWGQVYSFRNNPPSSHTMPIPTQVSSDTNWTDFTTAGFFNVMVRNRAGELWELFRSAPNGELPAAATCHLFLTNSQPDHVALAYVGKPTIYEIRADGTLWQRTYPISLWLGEPEGKWRRVGRRSDWIFIQSLGGTAFGLTSDGTLWTWGIDPSLDPKPDFSARLQLLQARLKNFFGGSPPSGFGSASFTPQYQKDPRPLLKLGAKNPSSAN